MSRVLIGTLVGLVLGFFLYDHLIRYAAGDAD